jgi:DNA-binding transcriptional MerR regulator
MPEKKQRRPKQPKIDSSGYRLFTTGEAAELLNLSIQTIRSWCNSGRLISIRGPSDGKRAGNRYISESELQRVRSDNAFTTVNEAVNRMEAIIDDRDATIIELIDEKSGIQSHNFAALDGRITNHFVNLEKRIDRLERAKPPTIQLSESAIHKIARIVLAEAARSGDVQPPSITSHGDSPPDARPSQPDELNHVRKVSEDERNRMIGENL